MLKGLIIVFHPSILHGVTPGDVKEGESFPILFQNSYLLFVHHILSVKCMCEWRAVLQLVLLDDQTLESGSGPFWRAVLE